MKGALALALIALLAVPAGAANLQRVVDRFGCTTGEAVTIGQALMMKSDGLCYKADADDSTLRPAIGIAGYSAGSGASVSVVTGGQVGGETGLTKGGAIYLSATAGGNTQTQPSAFSQVLGRAISATQWTIAVAPPQPVKVFITTVESLAADADIGDLTAGGARTIFVAPRDLTISAVKIYGRGSGTAIGAYNSTVRIYNGSNVVVVKTFNTPTAWPDAYTPNDLGTVANANVSSGASVKFDVTNGLTADPPAGQELPLNHFRRILATQTGLKDDIKASHGPHGGGAGGGTVTFPGATVSIPAVTVPVKP